MHYAVCGLSLAFHNVITGLKSMCAKSSFVFFLSILWLWHQVLTNIVLTETSIRWFKVYCLGKLMSHCKHNDIIMLNANLFIISIEVLRNFLLKFDSLTNSRYGANDIIDLLWSETLYNPTLNENQIVVTHIMRLVVYFWNQPL